MKVCWECADTFMRELGKTHAADGHEEEAIEGYARFLEEMKRQKEIQKGEG